MMYLINHTFSGYRCFHKTPDIKKTLSKKNNDFPEQVKIPALVYRALYFGSSACLSTLEFDNSNFKTLTEHYNKSINKDLPATKAENSYQDFKNLIVNLSEFYKKDENCILEKLVASSIKPDKLVGQGNFNFVYSIPGVDEFLLRVPNNGDFHCGFMKKTEDKFEDLNIGQAVAEIGRNIKILKKQEGIPGGIPYEISSYLKEKIRKSKPLNREKLQEGLDKYLEHLKRTAYMPQSAYDDFARTIKVIADRGYIFDIKNANNVLIDESANKFNIVDDLIIKGEYGDFAGDGSLKDMIVPLSDFGAGILYCRDRLGVCRKNSVEVPKLEISGYISEIIDKCFIASKNADLLIPEKGGLIIDTLSLGGKGQWHWMWIKDQLIKANEGKV